MSFNIYDGKLYEKSLQELEFFIQQVNDGLEDVEKLSYEIAISSEIQEQLMHMKDLRYPSNEYLYELEKLRTLFTNKLYLYPIVKNIVYTDHTQTITKVGSDTGGLQNNVVEKLIADYGAEKGIYVSYAPSSEYPYLVSGRDILEIKNTSLDYLGSIILTSDVKGLIDQCNARLKVVNPTLYVYSEDKLIYENTDMQLTELPPPDQAEGYQIIRMDGQKYFMCYLRSSQTDWLYISVFPYSQIFGQTSAIRYLTLSSILSATIIMLLMIRKIVEIVTRPLQTLSESMKTVEGQNFREAQKLIEDEDRKDEIGVLTKEFQIMLDKIEHLIYENYEKQILIQDTRYKMLQAQINPHFLYNTLNSLNWMLKSGQTEEVGQGIIELGKLLRASFAKSTCTSVEEECDTAAAYIHIQQMRYKGRAKMELKTDGNLSRWMIPRMVLQPIIENAVQYGIESSAVLCEVLVYVVERDTDILIFVKDSGQGMSSEELEKVRAGTIEPQGHGIGLKNIRERLAMFYTNHIFSIDSETGIGTEVQIVVPKVEEEKNVQTADCR
ncbi:MAG: sensor histidine kinase [bacterium]|nr:sensor histidine kinase [bacterium]